MKSYWSKYLVRGQPMTLIIILLHLFIAIPLLASTQKEKKTTVKNYYHFDYQAAPGNHAALFDLRGILYIANDNGVLEYDGLQWNLIKVSNFSGARSLAIDENNRIYVGAIGEFGYLTSDSLGRTTYYSLSSLMDEPPIKFDDVWQVLQVDEKVYFQTYEGLFSWDGKSTTYIAVKDSYIFNINGQLLASKFDYGFGRVVNDSVYLDFPGGSMDNDVVFQVLPYQEKFIFATPDHGLFILSDQNSDSERATISYFHSQASDLLKEHGFYDGIQISDNLYALGTWYGGVLLMDINGEVIEIINQSQGLSDLGINGLALGMDNDLWIAGNNNISKIQLSSITPLVKKRKNSKPLIRSINVDSQPQIFNINNRGNKNPLFETSTQFNSLTFDFCAPQFGLESKIEYSILLHGFDREWSTWKQENKKEYTNLPGGTYQFNVKARNSNGVESLPATFIFVVKPPWYQSPWMNLIYLITGIFSFILLVKWRTGRLKKINATLGIILNQRTKEIQKTNRELIKANRELDNFVYRTSHDLMAPLKSLLGLMGVAKMETSDKQQINYIKMMEERVHKLEEFITSIMAYSTNVNARVTYELVEMELLLKEILQDLKYYDNSEMVRFEYQIEENSEVINLDRNRLKIVLSNLINNAYKYYDPKKEDPNVMIMVKRHKDSINILVEDNGLGINAERIDKIFNMFYRASETSKGSGLGLYIVKEAVEKMDGNISVTSEKGKGTRFLIELKTTEHQEERLTENQATSS